MVWEFIRTLKARLKEQSTAKRLECGTICGKQGAEGEPPAANLSLAKPTATIVASHSGPDTGVAMYKQFAPDLPAPWDNPVDWAYGISVSMYDLGPTGRRNGEPVADCFGILAYPEGAILAVADGVNWGEPPRRAARCAVLGTLQHMHNSLRQHEAASDLDSHTVFRHLVDSLAASQKLILQQFGTLTTLVVSVVLPLKWVRSPGRWAAITMTVGDSAAYVYRSSSRRVEEVTAAAHAEGARDPRWCPGALGYAMGEEPDLANMMLCLTFLDEGDFIFLTSDGVADNFDPVIRKLARHQILESTDNDLPALSPAECQAKAMDLLRDVLVDADERLAAGAQPTTVAAAAAAAAAAPGSPAAGGSGAGSVASGGGGAGGGAGGGGVSAGCIGGGGGGGGMTARGLAEQLLQHVYEVTAEQRAHVEARSRERERDRGQRREPGLGGGPSLGTDAKHGGLMGLAPAARPPGKMDHATVAAYQVGRRKPSAVLKGRGQPQPDEPPMPFLAAQTPAPPSRNLAAPAQHAAAAQGQVPAHAAPSSPPRVGPIMLAVSGQHAGHEAGLNGYAGAAAGGGAGGGVGGGGGGVVVANLLGAGRVAEPPAGGLAVGVSGWDSNDP